MQEQAPRIKPPNNERPPIIVSYEKLEADIGNLGEIPAAKKLMVQLEDTDPKDTAELMRIQKALDIIKEKRQLISEKKFSIRDAGHEHNGLHRELEQRALEQIQKILVEVRKRGKHLGEGATGVVYTDSQESSRCYKIIYDSEEYKHVNSVAREAEFLSALSDLEVEGVRAPKPHYWAMHETYHVLVMETLNAISIDKIVQGFETMPAQFNLDTFFQKLEAYVTKMHERGIHHRDLNLQNIMVDKETGDPRVIDFGKSCTAMMNEDPYLQRNEDTKEVFRYPDDLEKLTENKLKIREYLAKKS